jgi:tape measure domain-containing protein
MAQIREDAARTPFDVDSLTQANQMLVSAGMSADEARKDVLNLANAIAATGGGSAELSRMAANMQQIQNVGKATAMDIRQFANAGINIYGLLADSMGITAKEAAELDVTYNQLAEALAHAAEEGGMYAGAMEAQSQTFNGRISTLKDNVKQLEGVLTEDLFSQLSDTALPKIQEWVATLLEAAEKDGISGALQAAKGILSELVQSLLTGIPDMLDAGLTLIENVLKGIGDGAPEGVPVILDFLGRILDVLADHVFTLLEAGLEAAGGLIDGLVQGLTGYSIQELWDAFTNIIDEIGRFFEELPGRAWQWGMDLIQNFVDGIKSHWNNLKGTLGEFGQKIADFIGFSEPKEGPLSNFHTFAPDMMQLYAQGIKDNKKLVTRELGDLAIDAKETLTADMLSPDMSSANIASGVSYDINNSRTAYNTAGATYIINVDGIDQLDEMLNWFENREIMGRMA